MKRMFGVLVALATILAMTAPAASASARSTKTEAQVHIEFSRVATGVGGVWANSQYVVYANSQYVNTPPQYGFSGGEVRILSAKTGKPVSSAFGSACGLPLQTEEMPVGGSSLIFNCGDSPSIYNITQQRSVPVPNCVEYDPTTGSSCYANAVGTDWVQLANTCEHCGTTYSFESIATGQVVNSLSGWTPGGHVIPNLNGPSLGEKLCSPLSVPSTPAQGYGPGAGTLTFDGKFAIAYGNDNQGNFADYIERCGTRLHKLVRICAGGSSCDVATSPHTMIWEPANAKPTELSGVRLPSLQPFVVPTPKGLAGVVVNVTSAANKLYVLTTSGQLWTGTMPS
jgi:hypothetical protein